MRKIELTEEQVQRLRGLWSTPGTYHEALEKVANELVAMGLVRPASDDLAARVDSATERCKAHANILRDFEARVAALEAKVNASEKIAADVLGQLDRLWVKVGNFAVPSIPQTPDPHAAAKERAKFWGVELVEDASGCHFAAGIRWYCADLKRWLDGSKNTPPQKWLCTSCYFNTPSEAWSNFPTEPPPGWEAPKPIGNLDLMVCQTCGETMEPAKVGKDENRRWECPECNASNAKPKPRTDADRLDGLAEVAYEAWHGITTHSPLDRMPPLTQRDFRNAALAVRKAVLTSQLEPSKEEVDEACKAYLRGPKDRSAPYADWNRMTTVLIAAARVRLEKAEGEKP